MDEATKASLLLAIQGYAAELASDAANPQPSYTKDGQSVDRNTWRSGIFDLMMKAQAMLNQSTPAWKRTEITPTGDYRQSWW